LISLHSGSDTPIIKRDEIIEEFKFETILEIESGCSDSFSEEENNA